MACRLAPSKGGGVNAESGASVSHPQFSICKDQNSECAFHVRPARDDDYWKKRQKSSQERLKERNKIWLERRKEDRDLRLQRQRDEADWRKKKNLLNPNRELLWKHKRDIQKEQRKEDLQNKQRRFLEDHKRNLQHRKEDAEQRRKNQLQFPDRNLGRKQWLNKGDDCPEKKDDGRFRLKSFC